MASILPLVFHPDDRLRTVSSDIDVEAVTGLSTLIDDMAVTMIADKGIGLAAPQIGKNIRLIIVNTKDGPEAMINPILTKKSLRQDWGEEGCLSIPGVFGQVKRHKTVRCEFTDKTGVKRKVDATGLMARVIQHEIDHLDGILFIDTAKDIHEA